MKAFCDKMKEDVERFKLIDEPNRQVKNEALLFLKRYDQETEVHENLF